MSLILDGTLEIAAHLQWVIANLICLMHMFRPIAISSRKFEIIFKIGMVSFTHAQRFELPSNISTLFQREIIGICMIHTSTDGCISRYIIHTHVNWNILLFTYLGSMGMKNTMYVISLYSIYCHSFFFLFLLFFL